MIGCPLLHSYGLRQLQWALCWWAKCSISLSLALWVEVLWKGKTKSTLEESFSVPQDKFLPSVLHSMQSRYYWRELFISSIMVQKEVECVLLLRSYTFEINDSFLMWPSLLGSCLISIQDTVTIPFRVIFCQILVWRWHGLGDVNLWSHSILLTLSL